MWTKLTKDEKGFTGLEAAIVLIAFVVVAAVFSYVMLGAGFFTTQKSQEVVHTGVTQASSSVEVSGDVVAADDTAGTSLGKVSLFLQLTSGGSPVDMSKTLIVYTDPGTPPTELRLGDGFTIGAANKYNANDDDILEKGEKFQVDIDISGYTVGPNEGFQLEIKPPQGATYTIHRTAPPSISDIMTLV